MGTSRSRLGRWAGLVVVLATSACVTISVGGPEPSEPEVVGAAVLLQDHEPAAGTAIVMPVDPPATTLLTSIGTNGSIHTYTFVDRDDLTPIDICVLPDGIEPVGGCIPTQQPDMPILNEVQYDGYRALVTGGDDPTRRAARWADLELTTQWQDLDWVYEQRN